MYRQFALPNSCSMILPYGHFNRNSSRSRLWVLPCVTDSLPGSPSGSLSIRHMYMILQCAVNQLSTRYLAVNRRGILNIYLLTCATRFLEFGEQISRCVVLGSQGTREVQHPIASVEKLKLFRYCTKQRRRQRVQQTSLIFHACVKCHL